MAPRRQTYLAIGATPESARDQISALGPAPTGVAPTPSVGQVLTWNGTAYVPMPGGGGATPTFSAVLGAGNVTGAHDILVTVGQKIDTTAAGQLALGTSSATSLAIGQPTGGSATFQVFINQGGGALHGSNSGVQYASDFANRGQYRAGQYGNNAGIPGLSTFKSRATTIGGLAPVQVGDVIFRDTAVGVTDNLSIPLSGLISINVTSVPAASGWIGTEYELSLVPNEGPANGRKVMFKVSSQGVPVLRETALPGGGKTAGLALLDGTGNVTVANASVKVGTRFTLTIQDGGAAPTGGAIYVSTRVAATSFTITSTAGAGDAGVQVYWQLFEGI